MTPASIVTTTGRRRNESIMTQRVTPLREQQAEAAKLAGAARLPRCAWRRQVAANLKELGYGG